eukprot:1586001-Ditylum_brightwellii.AAC.1
MDVNMIKAATEKHKKYQDLKIAIKKQYILYKIQTVQILIGALRALYQDFDTHLAKVSARTCAAMVQKEELLGTSHIVHHVLKDMTFYL